MTSVSPDFGLVTCSLYVPLLATPGVAASLSVRSGEVWSTPYSKLSYSPVTSRSAVTFRRNVGVTASTRE